MRALVLKDLYVLSRQMRAFLLMIVLFSVVPGMNMTVFAVVYATMMPYTALAYDERSHWEQLARMMPYSSRDIVLGKYVLGWLFTGGAALLALLAGTAERALGIDAASPAGVGVAFCVGMLVMALTLPPMFRFGVEKGRMFFITLIVVVSCGSAGLASGLVEAGALSGLSAPTLALPAVAVAGTLLSILLSVRMYEKRINA
jgi:hypothetical protein